MKKFSYGLMLIAFAWLSVLTGFVCKIKADTSYEITLVSYSWHSYLDYKYTAKEFYTYSTIFYVLAGVFLLLAVVILLYGLFKRKKKQANPIKAL